MMNVFIKIMEDILGGAKGGRDGRREGGARDHNKNIGIPIAFID